MKKIENSYGGFLTHWVGGLMLIIVQTFYDIQYLTMRLSVYINDLTEPAFLSPIHVVEYIMHHPHEPIMYSRK